MKLLDLFNKKEKSIVGLEIGSLGMRAVQIDTVTKQIQAYSSKKILQGAIVDGEIMDRDLVIEALQELFSKGNFTTKDVAISISGRAVRNKKLEYNKMSPEEVLENIKMDKDIVPSQDSNEVVIDYAILDEEASSPDKMSVIVIVAKRDTIDANVELLYDAGLNPVIVDVSAFSVQNAYEFCYGTNDKITALVNIGNDITNLNIIKNGIPLFFRDLNVGGNNFSETLQRKINLSYEQALELLDGNTSIADTLQTGIFENVIGEITNNIAQVLERSLFYLKNTKEDYELDEIVLCGDYSLIPTAVDFLSNKYNVKTSVANPLEKFEFAPSLFQGEDITKLSSKLLIPIGLGLRKVGDR